MKGLKMNKWIVKELVDSRLVSTELPKDEAIKLFNKLSAKDIGCILYTRVDGDLILIDSHTLKIEAPTIVTSKTSDSFNDHSGLSEHSTHEDNYNKRGRL